MIGSSAINISNVNVEQDFNMTNASQGGSLSDAISAAQANTPAAQANTPASPVFNIPSMPQPAVAVQAATVQAAAVQPAAVPLSASAITWNWAVSTAKQANS